jgi:hypothetical protein
MRFGNTSVLHGSNYGCFISDKARTVSVLNGLKTTQLMISFDLRNNFQNKR